MPIPISNAADLTPGKLYEDAFYHPCVAIWVEEDAVCGVSLVDGSYPRCADLKFDGIRKLTVDEAWRWRLTGPSDTQVPEDVRWWSNADVAEYDRWQAAIGPPSHTDVTPVFYFGPGEAPLDGDTYVAQVPAGISASAELHDALAVRLMFPGWYGRNWDALYDLLRDLSWTNYHRLRIDHSDLPLAENPDSARKYLQVLDDAARGWHTSKDHELVAVFPDGVRTRVEDLLSG